jgi:hypothetical protein
MAALERSFAQEASAKAGSVTEEHASRRYPIGTSLLRRPKEEQATVGHETAQRGMSPANRHWPSGHRTVNQVI